MATLTTKTTETITLNGVDQGTTNTTSYTGINNVTKRIMTLVAGVYSQLVLFSAHTYTAGGSTKASTVKYIRITNLEAYNSDGSTSILLGFVGSATGMSITLNGGQSHIMDSPVDYMVATDAAAIPALSRTYSDNETLAGILASPASGDSQTAKIELFIATE